MTIKDIDIEELKKMDFRYKVGEDLTFPSGRGNKLFKALPNFAWDHLEIARVCRVKADAKYIDNSLAREKYFKLLMTEALKYFQKIKKLKPITSITTEQAELYYKKAHYFSHHARNKEINKLKRAKTLYEKLEGIKVKKLLVTPHPLTMRKMYWEGGNND